MVIVISNPIAVGNEHQTIRKLFDMGLEIFHIRKKVYSEQQIRAFIELIPHEHFNKLVLHSHYHLVAYYGLKGIHIPFTSDEDYINEKSFSISFHSIHEIQSIGKRFDYGFLSPMFTSISKEGYQGKFDLVKVKQFLQGRTEKILALGGIDVDKIEQVKDAGFSGVALLGAIWQCPEPVAKFEKIHKKWH